MSILSEKRIIIKVKKHKSKLPIEFQSLNFDIRFIDSLQRTYGKQESMVG